MHAGMRLVVDFISGNREFRIVVNFAVFDDFDVDDQGVEQSHRDGLELVGNEGRKAALQLFFDELIGDADDEAGLLDGSWADVLERGLPDHLRNLIFDNGGALVPDVFSVLGDRLVQGRLLSLLWLSDCVEVFSTQFLILLSGGIAREASG